MTLAQRLVEHPAKGNPAYVAYPGVFIDVERTRELWRASGGPAAIRREGGWVGNASVTIPSIYPITAQLLAYGLAARGDSAGAEKVLSEADQLSRSLRLTR